MKKVILIVIVSYILVIGVVFYIYFGPGVTAAYESLKWKDIETVAPVGARVKIYQDNGWDVYSLRKAALFIKVAVKPTMDVAGLPAYAQKLLYKASVRPGEIYYIANPRKTIEVVYARTMGDMTLYFSVACPSLFSGRYIMDKITGQCLYKGEKVTPSTSSAYPAPLRCYITDYLFIGAMTLPLLIILVIFFLSGKKPNAKHFIGDPIRCEESNIYFTRIMRFRRKGNLCYLALTASGQLRMFLFMRPLWAIDLRLKRPDLKIEANKIILQTEKEKIVFWSTKIQEWQEALRLFSY
ncbi:MAG: hypothetical protein QG657_3578 [Acidobacteriota bacterium]|nr:hypothetical protein [Acidobacteriota bacterium]